MCRIPRLVSRAKELGMDSLAITDHGVMYGVIEFYQAAREAGVKPIIGCEVYVAQGNRADRTPEAKTSYHLVLLAKDRTGYQNLMQLISKAHLEGFYYKPRVDRELLEQHCRGLVALSSCLGGEIPRLILEGRLPEAKEAALWYRQTFEDFYLEIQRHPIAKLERIKATSREKVVAICEEDIYLPDENILLGYADSLAGTAIISLFHIRQEFYGLPEDEAKIYPRLFKEVVHQVSHLFELNNCRNPRCVNYHSKLMLDIDSKGTKFCDVCRRQLTGLV